MHVLRVPMFPRNVAPIVASWHGGFHVDSLFKNSSNFASLSLKDLVEARDLFHNHLSNKKNVVGTALGLYRIRKSDPWPTKAHHHEQKRKTKSERRTLFNRRFVPIRGRASMCSYPIGKTRQVSVRVTHQMSFRKVFSCLTGVSSRSASLKPGCRNTLRTCRSTPTTAGRAIYWDPAPRSSTRMDRAWPAWLRRVGSCATASGIMS